MRTFAISSPGVGRPPVSRQESSPVAKKKAKKSSRRKPTRTSAEERHLDQGEQGSEVERRLDERLKKDGWWFDRQEAERVCFFFERYLRHSKGEWFGKPLHLEDWQRRYLRRKFGWRRPDGTRRYRRSVAFVPRKNGKSTIAAGEELYHLTADGEPGAQVYSTASNREQASQVFDEAKSMVNASPELSEMLTVYKDSIFYQPMLSRLQAISSKPGSKHGFNPHAVVVDEVHALPSRELYDVMTTGFAARRQPMETVISTAGDDIGSFGFELWEYACKLRDGVLEDPEALAMVYAADPDADWMSEEIWRATNPNFGVSVKADFLRGELKKAQGMPGRVAAFKQLYLNIWAQALKAWLDVQRWKKCPRVAWLPERYHRRDCYVGLDLSRTTALTAAAYVFPNDDGTADAFFRFWCPESHVDTRVRRDQVRYDAWIQEGHLLTTPGNVVDYGFIRRQLQDLKRVVRIKEVVYDRWMAAMLVQQLQDEDGLTMVEHGQGFRDMSPACKELERALLSDLIRHDGNPIMDWMVSNVIVDTDAAENIKLNKEKSRDRIDGVVALVMALQRATLREPGSVYNNRGLIVL